MTENPTKKEAKIEQTSPTTTTIDSLPRELTLQIISRLPIQSLIRTKWVCKSWRSIAEDPVLARFQFSRMPAHNPCLLLHDIRNHLYSLHFSTEDDTILETKTRVFVPMMSQFFVVGSCNGLLCLWHSLYQDESYIFNPFTRTYIQLPKPKHFLTHQRVATGFGFNSVTKEYKVVRIIYFRRNAVEHVRRHPPQSEVEVLTIENVVSKWRSKGEIAYQIKGEPSHVLVNGRLHWLSYRTGHQSPIIIISFYLNDEQFRQIPNPNYKRFGIFCTQLVSLRGCLCGIVRGYELLDIWVMKEYGVQESWVKEFRIGFQLPTALDPYPDRSSNVLNFCLSSAQVRVLCVLKNGDILLEHDSRTLIVYDVKCDMLKELAMARDLPDWFQSIVHNGTLNWIDTPTDL